ncbi:uncharacterized protein G2W53_033798 [Senna tora]|uniref:Uncharacterized protein n=1 Tax=Senna tora TaxID=362788 RepID=A0A834T2W4_9FABA|nr:uncharacterized protein G2W53_033798 [Senna tora]
MLTDYDMVGQLDSVRAKVPTVGDSSSRALLWMSFQLRVVQVSNPGVHRLLKIVLLLLSQSWATQVSGNGSLLCYYMEFIAGMNDSQYR